MPDQSDQIAADIAALRDNLAGIGIDDSSQGAAADAVRNALAERGAHLAEIAAAARAVARAVAEHHDLVADWAAETPSDDEIHAAQEAVITAADAAADGTGSEKQVQDAVNNLATLLDQKQQAQDKFDQGQTASAAVLDDATKDLATSARPAASVANALASTLASLNALRPATQPPAAPAPGAGAEGTPVPAMAGDPAASLDTLAGGPGAGWGASTSTPGDLPTGAGQTHTVADAGDIAQMPTLSGVQTAADISGRPANPFIAAPAAAAGASPQSGGGAMPFAPMAPMGSGGAASTKTQAKPTIMNSDPDFTGADIETQIATSGVIGRGEKQQ